MYIVTGGAGFIGSAVIWKLNTEGIDDILVVDNLGRSDKWKNLVNRRYTDYVHKSEFQALLSAGKFDGIDAIIHMGACSSTTEKDADFLMENNFHYSTAMAEYSLQNDIRMINASSAATYGDGSKGFSDRLESMQHLKPLNMYGYSKQLFDLWALRTGALKKIASLKFFNVYGPNEFHKDDMCSMVYRGFNQIRETGLLRLFKSYRPEYENGGQRRDFVYVKDCVEVVWWLLNHPEANGGFNIGTGKDRSWNDLAAALFKAMDKEINIEYIDMPDPLKDRYQYYTRAEMEKLTEAGCPVSFTSLEAAVTDYVRNYLQCEDVHL
ncbi:MAG: ADP-glyceromanno-heptose 6-epimerase [Deltaproteobacteria bacterium]|nr:ADP-glyceromanno-heptose 6-epimerase [Deltaproteobacteria bacterium]MBW2677864.1 ADP-glyceromanno-heptose 6-epimerase [Deltaproteobacteria bacterium]